MENGSTSPKIALPYQLFIHREELRQPRAHDLRLSRSKLNLTSKLLKANVPYISEFGMDDLQAINRQIDFKEELHWEIVRMHEEQAASNRSRDEDESHAQSSYL